MDTLQTYIREIDFEKHLNSIEKNLTENNYQNFTLEFWENPSIDITKLKAKYKIHNTISIASILSQNPIQEYYHLLEDIWKTNKDLDELIRIHRMKKVRMEQLLFPIMYRTKESFCPHCHESNEFDVSMKLKQRTIVVKCIRCENIVDHFINREEKEKFILEEEETLRVFNELIENIKEQLEGIKCDKCQATLEVVTTKENTYNIQCTRCSRLYNDLDEAKILYNRWKQRAVMMLKIKSREDEILERALEKKEMGDIKIKSEPIITKAEAIKVINELIIFQMKGENIFKELFKRYREMNRLDRKILTFICKECMHIDKMVRWGNEKDNIALEMQELTYEEPIISELSDKNKVISIRPSIRRLLDKSLLYCDEDLNIIHIHPLLTENIQYLEEFNKPQSIGNDIANLVFKRQNYICYHCSETGRPLKIAYLTGDKNYNDLSGLVGICDTCFYETTENEIVIDTVITAEGQVNNDLGKAYNFLCYWDEELRDSEITIIENEELIASYDEKEIIKAYAITLNKKHTTGINREERGFFDYAKAILRGEDGSVQVPKYILNKYDVKEWM